MTRGNEYAVGYEAARTDVRRLLGVGSARSVQWCIRLEGWAGAPLADELPHPAPQYKGFDGPAWDGRHLLTCSLCGVDLHGVPRTLTTNDSGLCDHHEALVTATDHNRREADHGIDG